MDLKNDDSTSDNNAFLINDAMYELESQADCLHLKCIETKQSYPHPLETLNKSIQLSDVISTSYVKDEWRVDQEGKPLLEYNFFSYYFLSSSSSCFTLKIHYWINMENYRRKLETVQLQTSDHKFCEDWKAKIDGIVKESIAKSGMLRPKNLLIIANPYAGNKTAKSVYEKAVSPLFKKADIETTVTFTEHKQHAVEYLESADLSEYDGVVAVGGDGTFNEVVHGVLINEQRKRNISLDGGESGDVKPAPYSKPPLRLGLIPAGSGNALNYTSQGTNDVETATLHIICGESHPFDVSSVHDEKGKFVRFSTLGVSYGFFSESIKISDNMRFLGRIRYKIAPLLLFANFQYYPGEVSYLLNSPNNPVDVNNETSKCRYPCPTCTDQLDTPQKGEVSKTIPALQHETTGHVPTVTGAKNHSNEAMSDLDITCNVSSQNKCSEEGNDNESGRVDTNLPSRISQQPNEVDQWKVSHGPFIMTSLLNTACRYEESPTGFVPSAHLADGTNDLILVHKAPRQEFMAYCQAASGPGKHFDFHFVEAHRVKAMRFRVRSERKCKPTDDQESSNLAKQSLSQGDKDDSSNLLEPSYWTCDGEKFSNLEITTWVHKGLINIFARGLESD